MTEETKSLTASVDPMSKAEVRWSRRVIRVSVSAMVAAFMSQRARVAPKLASFMAVPRPMPLPAPVIRITLSLNDGGIICT